MSSPRIPGSTPRRTPRSDLGNRLPRVFPPNEPDSDNNPQSDLFESEAQIHGTNISVEKSTEAFKDFWENFKDIEGNVFYDRVLREAIASHVTNINLNGENIYQHNPRLYADLITYPEDLIPLFDWVVNVYRKGILDSTGEGEEDDPSDRIQVRPFNLRESINMRELDPKDVDKLVSIKGMVIRTGEIIPEMKIAYFECRKCNANTQVVVEGGNVAEPTKCPDNTNCKGNFTMQLIHNRSQFADKQLIKLQEQPDDIPEGETPHTVDLYAYDDLVDVAKPGDRVSITGVYRANSVRTMSRQRSLKSIYKTHVDALHFQKGDKRTINMEDSRAPVSSEYYTTFEESDALEGQLKAREEKLIALSKDPNIYELLCASIAPSVWEMQDVKKGILCLLFGGANNEKGATHGRFRGELNMLMCGDPGTAKSQLLQAVHRISPRGIYTSGKGSSAVGLTASITRDQASGEMVLESGALVLSDRGVCCIDEFDKMSDSTRSILHEVMEQQTVSIAKGGIVATLNARTSILASANPQESRYNPEKSVVDNIHLGPTLLSRFDLIYLILDKPNPQKDRRLAKHLVSKYLKNVPDDVVPGISEANLIDRATLTQYISYARKAIMPKLSDEATDPLIEAYVNMRRLGQTGTAKVVTATPRMLESLIRLSEARARMRFSQVVEVEDVDEARRLMNVATQTAATDPKTGRIDMDLLATGHSTRDKERLQEMEDQLVEVLGNKSLTRDALFKAFNDQAQLKMGQTEFSDLLRDLGHGGSIRVTKKGRTEYIRALRG